MMAEPFWERTVFCGGRLLRLEAMTSEMHNTWSVHIEDAADAENFLHVTKSHPTRAAACTEALEFVQAVEAGEEE
jgi:hypothetical protein